LRWKLLVITSLAAAVLGAGLFVALASILSAYELRPPFRLGVATLLLPLASITYATIFVYRHTARRRKLQASLTALLSLLLTACALFASDVVVRRFEVKKPEPIMKSIGRAGA
jgi:hypothetical protein